MASQTEHAGVLRQTTFYKDGTNYRVFETRTKRSQDVFRFELWKEGSDMPYVVSFQNHSGSQGACSCPAGKFHRAKGECKHIRICRSEFMTGSASAPVAAPKARPAPSAVKALPAAWQPEQKSLGFEKMEVSAIEAEMASLRSDWSTKKLEADALKAEMAAIEAKGIALKAKLAALKSRAA